MKFQPASGHDRPDGNVRALTASTVAAVCLAALLAVAGCERDGPVEETLEDIDDAAESAGETLEEAADTAGDNIEETAESAEDSVEDAAEAVDEEIDDAAM